jgi:hypothetical protein
MIRSEVVEVDGVFLGTAILHAGCSGLTFVALHEDVRALNGQVWPTLEAVRRQVAGKYRGRHSVARSIPAVRSEPDATSRC